MWPKKKYYKRTQIQRPLAKVKFFALLFCCLVLYYLPLGFYLLMAFTSPCILRVYIHLFDLTHFSVAFKNFATLPVSFLTPTNQCLYLLKNTRHLQETGWAAICKEVDFIVITQKTSKAPRVNWPFFQKAAATFAVFHTKTKHYCLWSKFWRLVWIRRHTYYIRTHHTTVNYLYGHAWSSKHLVFFWVHTKGGIQQRS